MSMQQCIAMVLKNFRFVCIFSTDYIQMSKARSMYAGSSGMVNGTNAMCVQIGNKLQGLPPTTNKPAELINHITTKAEGDKRDYIFCINQLAGGVGRNVGQFADRKSVV